MAVIAVHWKVILGFLAAVLALVAYNEFVVYYLVLLQCSWPSLDRTSLDFSVAGVHHDEVKAIVLADTHLLGSREGHWFDRIRREWQMERAFQTAITIYNPDTVFVLGDLFDEGKWCGDAEFQDYTQRFRRMFRTPPTTELQVLVGNHDIGFHHAVDDNKRRRFASAMEAPSVKMVRQKDNIFILLNSMAFEGDQCNMCQETRREVSRLAKTLDCAKDNLDGSSCGNGKENIIYSRPIILQHYPMYRKSDANCTGADAAPLSERSMPFKPKWDCLSKMASDSLFNAFEPRLVISGHTHHFCLRAHPDGTPEWTVPSFSWRNKHNPSFLLLRVRNDDLAVSQCHMPDEQTVINTYIVGGGFIFLSLLVTMYRRTFLRKPAATHHITRKSS